jgi:hypothetical protein
MFLRSRLGSWLSRRVVVVVLLVLANSIPCAVVAGRISQRRGRQYDDGFLLGLFLGIFGVIIVANT